MKFGTPNHTPAPTDDLLAVSTAVIDRLLLYQATAVDATISSHDDMYQAERREHYFAVGNDAITIIAQAMIKAGVASFDRVVDLPCGSGRVLRHLVRFLPEASLIASDIVPHHVEFCARQFGAEPLLSSDDLTQVSIGDPADLIWCGSLLTHLSASRFKTALRHMASWLAPGGIGIFTLHGRWAHHRQAQTPHKYLGDDDFAPVLEGVDEIGFGYAPYPDLDLEILPESYGLSISMPSWVLRTIESMKDVRVLDFGERQWDNHQDVLVLHKVPIDAPPWIFES